MTIRRVNGAASPVTHGIGEGEPQYGDAAADLQIGNPIYNGRQIVPQPDSTLFPDTTNEGTLLEDGGLLSQTSVSLAADDTTRYAGLTATNVPGRNGFTLPTGGTNAVYAKPTFCLDGQLATDEWTIVLPVKCRGADLTTISGSRGLLYAGASLQSLAVTYSGGNLITATLTVDERNFLVPAGSNKTLTATVAVNSGDFPSNTWTNVTISFDQTYGLVVVTGKGDGTTGRKGTPNATWGGGGAMSDIRPWSGEPTVGGALVLGTTGGAGANPPDWGVDFQAPSVYRYSRYRVEQQVSGGGAYFRMRESPAFTIDASTTTADWQPNLGYVVDQHSNYGGADPNPVRDKQLDILANAGCPGMRFGIAGYMANVTNVGALTNQGGGIDWTGFDDYFQRYVDRGLHAEIGITYTPAGLRSGGTTQGTLPTSNANYATWASALIDRVSDLGLTLDAITGWNEPELTLGSGQVANYTALWTAIRNKLATDHPTKPRLSTAQSIMGVHMGTYSGNYLSAIIDEAHTQGFTLPLACVHGYDSQNRLTYLCEAIDAIRDYLDSKSLSATKIAIPEFSGFWTHQQPGGGDDLYPLTPWRSRMHEAAYLHAALSEMADRGVAMATYYRLGGSESGNDTPGLLAGTDEGVTNPRPYPAFHAYECIWKHAPNTGSGAPTDVDKVTATSNWPGLRVLASKAPSGRVNVSYSSLRLVNGRTHPETEVHLDWTNGAGLPDAFTWKQYRVEDEGSGRLSIVAEGDHTNLPTRVKIGALGVGAIEVTP